MPIFIFLSNFIILNTLIALSCEYFEEVKAHKVFGFKEDQKIQKIVDIKNVDVIN